MCGCEAITSIWRRCVGLQLLKNSSGLTFAIKFCICTCLHNGLLNTQNAGKKFSQTYMYTPSLPRVKIDISDIQNVMDSRVC